MGRDFPGRFGSGGDNFSSDGVGSAYDGVGITIDEVLSETYASGKQIVKKTWEGFLTHRQIEPHAIPDPEEDNDELDCADQVRATRKVAEELAVMAEIQRLGFGAVTAALVENAAWSARMYALVHDRTPHRKWIQGSVIDTQQQIRDGFDSLQQTLALWAEAHTSVKLSDVDLPELSPTPNSLDLPTDLDFQYAIWKAIKKTKALGG